MPPCPERDRCTEPASRDGLYNTFTIEGGLEDAWRREPRLTRPKLEPIGEDTETVIVPEGYVEKPFSLRDLWTRITRALR